MAALTPAKPDHLDVTSNAKIRVWLRPVFASGDTVLVPGIKRVFSVTSAKGLVIWTSSDAGNGLGSVVTLTVTGSSTGDSRPLVVYGQ